MPRRRAAAMTRKCIRCQRDLPVEDFHRDLRRKDGRRPYCRECEWSHTKSAMDADPARRERRLEQMRRWYEANRERHVAKVMERRQARQAAEQAAREGARARRAKSPRTPRAEGSA